MKNESIGSKLDRYWNIFEKFVYKNWIILCIVILNLYILVNTLIPPVFNTMGSVITSLTSDDSSMLNLTINSDVHVNKFIIRDEDNPDDESFFEITYILPGNDRQYILDFNVILEEYKNTNIEACIISGDSVVCEHIVSTSDDGYSFKFDNGLSNDINLQVTKDNDDINISVDYN